MLVYYISGAAILLVTLLLGCYLWYRSNRNVSERTPLLPFHPDPDIPTLAYEPTLFTVCTSPPSPASSQSSTLTPEGEQDKMKPLRIQIPSPEVSYQNSRPSDLLIVKTRPREYSGHTDTVVRSENEDETTFSEVKLN